MNDPFSIVKDSSIWYSSSDFSVFEKKDPQIRIGIVKQVTIDKATSDIRYLVEVRDRNDGIELNCRMMRKFGGIYNYEDVVMRGYKINDRPDTVTSFEAKAGDAVVVVALNGQTREGLILGGLTHPGRKVLTPSGNGPYYQSEFNGVETIINDNGEYVLTFKALQTNISKLKDKPSKKIEEPKYDTNIGGSYFKFDKTGSIELNDKAKSDPQRIRIDKSKGILYIESGKISLKMDKNNQSTSLSTKSLNIESTDKIIEKTKDYSIDANSSFKVKTPKVALGKDGVELLDQLSKLIDALGKVKPISPLGPCTPLMATPEWPDVAGIQSKIKEITGSL